MNRFVAGIVAAVPISIIGAIYVVGWGKKMVSSLIASDPSMAEGMNEGQWYIVFLVTMVLAPLLLGLISALVYGWAKSPTIFLGISLGAAVLITIAAIATRTPAMGMKIVANFLVALDFGILLPLLTGGWGK